MTCSICNNTGLIPFKNKQGRIVNDAFVYCECHRDEPDHYHQSDPSDFDFACSSAFRSYFSGLPDPASIQQVSSSLDPLPQVVEHIVIHRHSNMGAEEYDLLQQTSLKADWLEKKLLEKEKPKQKPKKTGYKGLR